jgi:hypothetical protein
MKLKGSDLAAIIMSDDSIPLWVISAIPFLQDVPLCENGQSATLLEKFIKP